MAFFSELVADTDEARRAFETHPAVLRAVAEGMSAQRYSALLLELYHVVWNFNPICAAAASRMDDAYQGIRYHLYDHMQDEKGHEEWVLDDLKALGVQPETARQHEPNAYTLALNGYNYWAADRRNPCSVLGMLYALEVIASVYGGPFATAIKESLLLDGERGISFIGSHATMDAQHIADLKQVLDKVANDEAKTAVTESAGVNFHHFAKIIEVVSEETP